MIIYCIKYWTYYIYDIRLDMILDYQMLAGMTLHVSICLGFPVRNTSVL